MKLFLAFIAGLACGALAFSLSASRGKPKQSLENIAVGDQTGLPKIQPGEFRVTLSDRFLSATMTEQEYLVLTNVFLRARVWKTNQPPVTQFVVPGFRD